MAEIKRALRVRAQRAKYYSDIALKQAASLALSTRRTPLLNPPDVTLFMSSLNTRQPLELTLKSLAATTRHPNYRLRIGDNASTDGSREYLQGLAKRMEIDLILGDKPRKHSEWLDEIYRTATTKYWMAVDTDILFVGRDWLTDMLSIMEANPDLYLLACEPRMGREGVVEPVGKETVDMGEAVATWLFVVRTTLRDQLPDASFAFHVDEQPSRNDRKLCYDTGGRLLAKMRAQGLRYGIMPSWFQMKYHHFGSLSWWAQYADSNDPAILFKKFQIGDIQRRLQTGRWPASPF